MTPETVLDEAARLTSADRQENYDHPTRNMGRTAAMWAAFLGVPITPRQVAVCMVLVKVAREAHVPKRDNLVDIAGWARVAEMTEEERDAAIAAKGAK